MKIDRFFSSTGNFWISGLAVALALCRMWGADAKADYYVAPNGDDR